ncbi:Hypothetical predicted protein, partial [Paramuricea clavata]
MPTDDLPAFDSRLRSYQLRQRCQKQGETFDDFLTDLKLFARGLDIEETVKLIRNAITCKSFYERVKQRCLEKSKNLTLETAINIGRLFEATKDEMQVITGEDPNVTVHGIHGKRVYDPHRSIKDVVKIVTNHKKNVQPRTKPAASVERWDTLVDEETDSSDDEYQQAKNLHLLHLKSLRIHEASVMTAKQLQSVAPDPTPDCAQKMHHTKSEKQGKRDL